MLLKILTHTGMFIIKHNAIIYETMVQSSTLRTKWQEQNDSYYKIHNTVSQPKCYVPLG